MVVRPLPAHPKQTGFVFCLRVSLGTRKRWHLQLLFQVILQILPTLGDGREVKNGRLALPCVIVTMVVLVVAFWFSWPVLRFSTVGTRGFEAELHSQLLQLRQIILQVEQWRFAMTAQLSIMASEQHASQHPQKIAF